jgi:hypothetical protein
MRSRERDVIGEIGAIKSLALGSRCGFADDDGEFGTDGTTAFDVREQMQKVR